MTTEEMMDLGFSDQLINQLTEITKAIAADVRRIMTEERTEDGNDE